MNTIGLTKRSSERSLAQAPLIAWLNRFLFSGPVSGGRLLSGSRSIVIMKPSSHEVMVREAYAAQYADPIALRQGCIG